MMPSGIQRASSQNDSRSHGRHCRQLTRILPSRGIAADARAVWLHLGPIGTRTMPVIAHGDQPFCRRIAGLGDPPVVRTWRSCRPYVGFRLHLVGLVERPQTTAARPIAIGLGASSLLYLVYAAAELRVDGPYAEWEVEPGGGATISYRFTNDRPPRYEDLAELGRCLELLRLANPRPGRKPLYTDAAPLELAEQAAALRAAYPWLSYPLIAARLGVSERTLRRYRALGDDSSVPTPRSGLTYLEGFP